MRLLTMVLAVAVLAAAPLFMTSYLLGVLTNGLIAALFALAFNLLAGQAGLLSFGHAAYFSAGGFAVIHLMKAVESGRVSFPTPLLPLVGGLAGLLSGAVAGFFATRRGGAYFSMVTLAMAELLYGIAPSITGIVGGESGLSSMRMPWLAFDFGSDEQVYYVVLAWAAASTGLLYAYNQTLLGKLTVGLRESERRLSFLGYNTQLLKIVVFAVSAMFSGVAGGLLVFSMESINYSMLGLGTSTVVILNTFIGGSSVFLGPAIGAVFVTFFGSLASDVTRNWLLYQGLIFALIMTFWGDGLVAKADSIARDAAAGRMTGLVRAVRLLPAVLCMGFGVVLVVELLSGIFDRDYRATVSHSGTWPPITVFWCRWPPAAIVTWAAPLIAIVLGVLLARLATRHRKHVEPPRVLGSETP
jgi:branched-chain amino acid transport system permease protein